MPEMQFGHWYFAEPECWFVPVFDRDADIGERDPWGVLLLWHEEDGVRRPRGLKRPQPQPHRELHRRPHPSRAHATSLVLHSGLKPRV